MFDDVVSKCIHTPGKLKSLLDRGGNHHPQSNLPDLVTQLVEHWTSKPNVAGSISTAVKIISLPGVDTLQDNITKRHFVISKLSHLNQLCPKAKRYLKKTDILLIQNFKNDILFSDKTCQEKMEI